MFDAKSLEEAKKYIRMARKEVWADAYKGHNKFMAVLKTYYS